MGIKEVLMDHGELDHEMSELEENEPWEEERAEDIDMWE